MEIPKSCSPADPADSGKIETAPAHPGNSQELEPTCSTFRGAERRGRGGRRKNFKRENEGHGAPSLGSTQPPFPPFYGFFTSPLRSSNRGRCKKNSTSFNTSGAIPSSLVTSSSMKEVPGCSAAAEKNLAETRLHQATRLGCEDLVWHFLSVDCIHANVQDNNGTTPLHICSSSGHVNIALLLLSFGAQPNSKALDGSRPLHNAVLGNHFRLVRLLLTYGADPTLTNFEGRTPIQLCKTKKMKNFLRGFSNDVNGCGDVLWGFNETMYNDCGDFLSNLPDDNGDGNDIDDDGEIQFDVLPSAPLPVYNVQQDNGSRVQACHLLSDVCKTLGTSQKFCSKRLNIVESSKVIPSVQHDPKDHHHHHQQQQQHHHVKHQEPTSLKYVAIDNHLRKLMKAETFKVQRWTRTKKQTEGDRQAEKEIEAEEKKNSRKKQNVVESLSRLAKICKDTSNMVERKLNLNNSTGAGDGKTKQKTRPESTSACSEPLPLPVLDRHENGSREEEEEDNGEERSTPGRKNKSEDMEMPQLTLYS